MRLIHVIARAEWAAASRAREVRPASLETEGFVHLCTEAQLPGVLARYYAGRDDLVRLTVDTDLLDAELRWEAPSAPADAAHAAERFPHLYGPLPLGAVVAADPVAAIGS